jgi:RNA polymerase sigma-70 factor (ECF subfamily)
VTEREMSLAGREAIAERDARLVAGLREGAPEAASELCGRFGPKLLAFAAARFPADKAVAEDIAVASLAYAAHNVRQFNPRRSTLLAWIYGIARRQIREEIRRRTRLKSVPSSAQTPLEEVAGVADGTDVAASVARRLDAQRLLVQLARELSEIELEVLLLDSVHELSVREIGQVVGRSERAIHSLLHRARTKARERLTQDGY